MSALINKYILAISFSAILLPLHVYANPLHDLFLGSIRDQKQGPSHRELIGWLRQHPTVDVNEADDAGTPIEIAVLNFRLDWFGALRQIGQFRVDALNRAGLTALQVAVNQYERTSDIRERMRLQCMIVQLILAGANMHFRTTPNMDTALGLARALELRQAMLDAEQRRAEGLANADEDENEGQEPAASGSSGDAQEEDWEAGLDAGSRRGSRIVLRPNQEQAAEWLSDDDEGPSSNESPSSSTISINATATAAPRSSYHLLPLPPPSTRHSG